MTGYLERLIGRVAHGQADTRPAPAFRFAPDAAGSIPSETPETFETSVAEPAQAEPERPRQLPAETPSTVVPPRPSPRETVRERGRLVPQVAAALLQREGGAPRARPTTSLEPQSSVMIGEEPPAHAQARPVRPDAWPVRQALAGGTRSPPESEDTTAARDAAIPEPTFLLPPQPDATSTIPSREQTSPRTVGTDLPRVTVRIGRIEIRREPTKPADRRAPAAPRHRPRLGLDEYLDQRRRGER
jgi:hypothetical protein